LIEIRSIWRSGVSSGDGTGVGVGVGEEKILIRWDLLKVGLQNFILENN